MRFGRFLLGLLISTLGVFIVVGFLEYLATDIKHWLTLPTITWGSGGGLAEPTAYKLLYASLTATGAVIGSIITWLFVASGNRQQGGKPAQATAPAKGTATRKTQQKKQGAMSGQSEVAADISSMPSFDFDKAHDDIKQTGGQPTEENKL